MEREEPRDDLDETEPRSKLHRALTAAVPALIVVALLAYGLLKPADEPVSDDRLTYELPLLSGDGVMSNEDLEGSPVVLNFWASWCVPCREETPVFQKMWERYRDDGLQIVGVNTLDNTQGAKEFVDEFGITYPILRDEDLELHDQLALAGLPQTIFIDADGRSVATEAGRRVGGNDQGIFLGPISEDELEERIRGLREGS